MSEKNVQQNKTIIKQTLISNGHLISVVRTTDIIEQETKRVRSSIRYLPVFCTYVK